MDNSNLLFESIFKRKLSAPDTRDYLSQIAKEYPYFSPAQFFLLLQADKGTTAYQQQAVKTAILFNNPYWLQFQLNEQEQGLYPVTDNLVEVDNESILTGQQENTFPAISEKNDREANIKTSDINKEETEEITPESDPVLTNVEPFPLPEARIVSGPENDGAQVIAVNEIEPVLNQPPVIITPETEEVISTEVIDTGYNGSIVSKVPDESTIIDTQPSGHFNNDTSPLVNETGNQEDPVEEPDIEPLHFKLTIDTSSVTEDRIAFEPLHTTDYFASLGIKLSGEIISSDKLGKQLKSFTEWLKTMKKIHSDQLPQQSGQADSSIQKLAELSNKQDAILTEAMAEVLLQQGKAGKAIEVYGKLSLLNPSKSAYFAAKIDQLKEH